MGISMKALKKFKKSTWVLIILFALCIILNATARLSTTFSDWYTQNIFPFWTASFGRLTSLLPISLGEILIWIGVIGLPLSLVSMIVLLIIKKGKRKKIAKTYIFTYLWLLCFVLVTETLNCFILYQASSFGTLYDIPQEEHTPYELSLLARDLIDQTNELAAQVERDENGHFVLTTDLNKTARTAVADLSDEFPQLAGYYVKPKPVMYSFFMSQQYLMGVYFPFTMEANYNKEMYSLNLPDTICHELAHTKGIIQEDEANFIGFLASIRSDDIEYQYSGYVNALKYVLSQVRDNCDDDTIDDIYALIDDRVFYDFSGNSAYWESVQESDKGIISSKTVAEVSDKAMEASLKLNGVSDGKKSYGRMVDLMLNYYSSEEDNRYAENNLQDKEN